MRTLPRYLQFLLALLAFATLHFLPAPAHAQKAAPVIDQFYADPATQFTPGTEITFTVEGTPRGKASVRVAGIRRNIPLQEVDRGVYEGSYTITTRDRVTAASTMRATLRARGRSVTESQPIGGGAVAAAPAAPAAPATPPAPPAPAKPAPVALSLVNFTVAPIPRIEPGADLKFTLTGTPGAKASFTIENIAKDVAMQEVKPGVYEGSYTIRRNDQFTAGVAIVGTLEANGQVNRMRLAQPLVQDAKTPVVKNAAPRDRETVHANPVVVSGTFDDVGGSGIDPASVRLVVGGNDVTRSAVITPQFFTYRSELRPGTYQVEVSAKDRSGNPLRHAWSFTVATQAAAATGLPLQILSHQNNAQVPNGPIEVRGRTAPDATVDVAVNGTAALAGAFGVSQQVFNQRLQADGAGNFSFTFQSPLPLPGARFEATIVASKGGQTKDTRLVLFQQR